MQAIDYKIVGASRVFAMQTTKSADMFAVFGGKAEIDQAIAAGLCAGMKREWFLAARLKWALDWSVANELEYLLWIQGANFAVAEKWKIPKGEERIRALAGLAIAEMAMPARWKLDSEKAEFIGIDKSRFSRAWKKRYNLIYSELEDWANSAYSYVMMRQRYEKEADNESR